MFKFGGFDSNSLGKYYTPSPFRHQHLKLILALGIFFISTSVVSAYYYLEIMPKQEAQVLEISTMETPTPTLTQTPEASPSATATPKLEEKKELASAPATKSYTPLALGFPNNKVGIHIYADPADVTLASELVNSNGGDWGWVTLNFDINDLNSTRWNMIFSEMRARHIVPIIQLYNHSKVPTREQTEKAADFLNSLNWPTRYRFITVYNEVNANEYWDWKIDPAGYAQVLNFTVDIFKARSGNFFMMNGAFNASARTDTVTTDLGVRTSYMSEEIYLQKMEQAVPGVLKKLDGWASHCYPHPYYSGRPLDWRMPNEAAWEAGRDTMSSYKWELGILQQYFGISGKPVFITEAGWPHAEGGPPKGPWHDQYTVGAFYKDMYEKLYFKDNRVVAVTPFILKISPLSNFSWIKEDGTKYPQWDDVVRIPKVKGSPPLE